jgi:hypothetical protein
MGWSWAEPDRHGGTVMLTRRTFIIAAATAWAGVASPAIAADAAAVAFVTAIYAAYKGKDAKGIALDSDTAIRRYFEPSLAAMISKDQKAAARRHEVPNLDGDPFVDAQDWDIAAVDIAVADTANNAARATATFKNGDTPTTVVLDLVKINDNWRISDITWQHDGKPETLRGLYGH